MRSREEGGGGLQGERKRNKVIVRQRERGTDEVLQDLLNIRSRWFPALCVGGEGVSVKSESKSESESSLPSMFAHTMNLLWCYWCLTMNKKRKNNNQRRLNKTKCKYIHIFTEREEMYNITNYKYKEINI